MKTIHEHNEYQQRNKNLTEYSNWVAKFTKGVQQQTQTEYSTNLKTVLLNY